MPDGDWATIANTNAKVVNDWQIGRKPADDGLVDWTGHYGSADEALAVLQSEIDQTHLNRADQFPTLGRGEFTVFNHRFRVTKAGDIARATKDRI